MKEENIDLSSQVGINLREIRRDKNISLEELANISDVSKLTLGKIERGEANPTLNILWKICRGLNIPLTHLLTFDENIEVYRFKDSHQLIEQNNNWIVNPLFKTHGTTEWYRACIEPNSRYSEFHLTGSEETIIVLNGQLEIQVGEKTHQLTQWDVFKFKGEELHTYINYSPESVYLMLSLTYKNP
ncbi:helix-turn-helix domain-containing protein [Priestia endophytica]|uniref:helix-turn-helix domain-containing protein n=1 Tax=Priestia endophytica TaxID=135735 RepID=UPI000DCA6315|nr:XRE family transcriptional regulator [Priestia endophytica]RAS77978.1 transcriptional regulator [Priestia endophytica]